MHDSEGKKSGSRLKSLTGSDFNNDLRRLLNLRLDSAIEVRHAAQQLERALVWAHSLRGRLSHLVGDDYNSKILLVKPDELVRAMLDLPESPGQIETRIKNQNNSIFEKHKSEEVQ